MTGYTHLTEDEKQFLIQMFNEVNFNKLHRSRKMCEAQLRAVKDKYIQGCLKALIKKGLCEEATEIANEILNKNHINEIMVDCRS